MPHQFTGKIEDLMIDYRTKKDKLVFAVNENAKQMFEEFKDCEALDIIIKKHRKKRSLDANAYYWVLISKLAKVLNTSNAEIHNHLLRLYGEPELFDGIPVYTTIPETEEAEKKVNTLMDYHLAPTSQVREGNDGVMYRTYRLIRGSHTFNSEEMARLIDGLIESCKEAGIPDSEIASTEERRILKERYGIDV